jgi:glucose-1-phosphate thymidylyltransferase
MFSAAVFDAVKTITPSARHELEITDAIQVLVDRGLEVRPHIVEGWWKDTGKLDDLLEANRLILDTIARRIEGSVDADSRVEGKVIVEPGAIVERSVVRGPVIVGARARIVNAFVGPFTSIMNDAEVRGSEIEHSIVLEGSSIVDLATRVEDSLIGKNVRIYRLPVKPSAYRFMLGDNSEVGIRW